MQPTRDELLEALEKAHLAGDVEGARELAVWTDELYGAKPEPAPVKESDFEAMKRAGKELGQDRIYTPVAEAKAAPAAPKVQPKPKDESRFSDWEMMAYEPSLLDRILEWGGDSASRRARASNEVQARRIAERDQVPVGDVYKSIGGQRPVINPEGRAPVRAALEGGSIVGDQFIKAEPLRGAVTTVLRTIRGGDETTEKSFIDNAIDWIEVPPPDDMDPNYQDLYGVGESLGYSLTSMAAASGAAIVTAPLGPQAQGAAGMVAAGGVAYRASKDQFLEDRLDAANAISEQVNGRPLSQDEWGDVYRQYESAAAKYGAWEAIPEAVGNMIFVRALALPLRGMGKQAVTEAAKRASQVMGSEQLTETITAVGQSHAEVEAGLRDKPLSFGEAFRAQAVPTAIVTALTGGAGSAAMAAEAKLAPGRVVGREMRRQADSMGSAPVPAGAGAAALNPDLAQVEAQVPGPRPMRDLLAEAIAAKGGNPDAILKPDYSSVQGQAMPENFNVPLPVGGASPILAGINPAGDEPLGGDRKAAPTDEQQAATIREQKTPDEINQEILDLGEEAQGRMDQWAKENPTAASLNAGLNSPSDFMTPEERQRFHILKLAAPSQDAAAAHARIQDRIKARETAKEAATQQDRPAMPATYSAGPILAGINPADEPQATDEQIVDIPKGDAPLNPKVRSAVIALNQAGIKTTMSGDLYGDDLIYIDIDEDALKRLDPAKLPEGWKLTGLDIKATKRDVLGIPIQEGDTDHSDYLGSRRLARAGNQPVTNAEGKALIAAFAGKPHAETEKPHAANYTPTLQTMVSQLVKGGGIALVDTAEGGKKRLPSVNPEWFKSMQQDPTLKLSVAKVQAAVEKMARGEELTPREARVIDFMRAEIDDTGGSGEVVEIGGARDRRNAPARAAIDSFAQEHGLPADRLAFMPRPGTGGPYVLTMDTEDGGFIELTTPVNEITAGKLPTVKTFKERVSLAKITKAKGGGGSKPWFKVSEDAATIQDRKKTPEEAGQTAFNFDQPATVATAKAQATDNFNTFYKRVPVAEARIGIDKVTTPEDVAHVVAAIRKQTEEVFYALVVDKDGNILDLQHHSKGTRDGASVYPEVVGPAVVAVPGAAKVYFAHNHPSGLSNPSRADFMITGRLNDFLDGSGVELAGHVIMGRGASAHFFTMEDMKWGGDDSQASEIKITPRPRNRVIPITERRARRLPSNDNREAVTQPSDAAKMIKRLSSDDAMILLDHRHRLIGVLSISSAEMRALRSGDSIKRILTAIDQTNASATIIKSSNEDAAVNLTRYLKSVDKLRVLDNFVPNPIPKEDRRLSVGEDFISLAERGMVAGEGPFLARRSDDDIFYGAGEGMATSEVRKLIGGSGRMRVVATVADLPAKIAKRIPAKDARNVQGVADPETGVIYLVAENLKPADVRRIRGHELVGHISMERVVKNWDKVQRDVLALVKKGDKQAAGLHAEVKRRGYNMEDRARVVREMLALAAERHVTEGVIGKILRYIRMAVNKLVKDGGAGSPTGTDIDELVAAAMRNARESGDGTQQDRAMTIGRPEISPRAVPTDMEPEQVTKKPRSDDDADAGDTLYAGAAAGPMPNWQHMYRSLGFPNRPASGTFKLGDRTVKLRPVEDPTRREGIRVLVEGIIGPRLYQSKIKGKRTLGFYRRSSSEVRTKHYDDVEVMAHEMAHFLDFHHGMKKRFTDAYSDPAYVDEVKSVSYTSAKDKVKSEGFAEFVRLWLTQYDEAKARVPNFTRRFEELLREDRKLGSKMFELQREMHRWYLQGPEATFRAKSGKDLSAAQQIIEFTHRQPMERMRQDLIDKIHGIKVVERTIFGGMQDATLSPYKQMQLVNGAEGMHESIMKDGTPTLNADGTYSFSGKGLHDIFWPAAKHGWKRFDLLMEFFKAKRALELSIQGRENLFTGQEIAKGLELGNKYPEFRAVFAEYQDFSGRMLDFYRQMGLITADQRASFAKYNKAYVPFHRVVERLEGGSGGGQVSKIGKRLAGGEQNTRDIATNIVESLHANIRAAMIARAKQTLYKGIMRSQDGSLFAVKLGPDSKKVKVELEQQAVKVAQVMAEMGMTISKDGMIVSGDPGADTITDVREIATTLMDNPDLLSFWTFGHKPTVAETYIDSAVIDGKRVWFEVHSPLLVDMLTGMGGLKSGALLNAMFRVKNLQTRTITSMLQFIGPNAVRDTLSAAVISKNRFIPIYSTLVGMGDAIFNTKTYREFRLHGGSYGTRIEARTEEMRSRRQLDLPSHNLWDRAAKLLAWWDRFTSAFEYGSRLGDFRAAKQGGKNALEAAWEAREVSTDFSKIGRNEMWAKFLRTVPFMNAGLQGLDKTSRELFEIKGEMKGTNLVRLQDGKVRFLMAGASVTMMTVLLWLMNNDDERYKALPKDQRARFWWIYLPDSDEPLKIPRPYDIGHIFATIPETALNYIEDKDGKEAADMLAWTLINTLGIGDYPGVLQPWFEAVTNKKFTGAPIIPDRMLEMPAEYQYRDRTPLLYRKLGQELGVSPLLAEHYTKGFLRYVEAYIADASEAYLWDKEKWGERPYADRHNGPIDYLTYQFRGQKVPFRTKWTEGYYELKKRAAGIVAASRLLTREALVRDDGPLNKFMQDEVNVTMRTINDSFSKIDRALGEQDIILAAIRYNKSMSAEEKERQIDDFYRSKNEVLGVFYRQAETQLEALEAKLEDN